MRYDHETLVGMSSATYYDLDLSRLGPRVKSTVIKALTMGVMPFDSGAAATTYSILCDAFNIPMMAFSDRTSYSLAVKRIPAVATQPLQQWWNLDRVTYRMEHPDDWNSYQKHHYYKTYVNMPDWIRNGTGIAETTFIPILNRKSKGDSANREHLSIVAKAFSDTQEYKDKVAPIIEKVVAGAIVQLKTINNEITGV